MSEVAGFGSILESGDQATYSGSTTWTPIAQIEDLEPPTEECTDIKTTHMTSANKTHTYRPGLNEPGMVKVKAQFTAANYTAWLALRGVVKGYRISFSDTLVTPSRLGFDGYLKSIGPKTPIDDIVTVELTFKVSGLPTFVAAA